MNIAVLAAFITYIGLGLSGNAGLGDYNLALDDSYQGKVVKGCPAYEEVRQPSMDNFDINKYEGLWYEHKFHDWTQFKEVYDTTLDIKVCWHGISTSFVWHKAETNPCHLIPFNQSGMIAYRRRERLDRRLWCPRPRSCHKSTILG